MLPPPPTPPPGSAIDFPGKLLISRLSFACYEVVNKRYKGICQFSAQLQQFNHLADSFKHFKNFSSKLNKSTSANVVYCITCTLCKKIYIGETGRRLGDRFREHPRDVQRNDRTHPNQSPDTSISLISLPNT